jgi:glycosyltransferase involved in cell wall biosynthesis
MVSLSICIPAFNRAQKLGALINSIISQGYDNIEIVVCEDFSPERDKIRCMVQSFSDKRIKYFENEANLGYDANLRKTIQCATGDYVILMGNDDLMMDGSLELISRKIAKYKPGVIVRSYESFYKKEKNFYQTHKYVVKDTLMSVTPKDFAWLFFRVVLVSGLVIERSNANRYQSSKVDGTLYYQNYLISLIATNSPVLYIPEILVKNRLEDAGDFGSSVAEKGGQWEPGKRTVASSCYQMQKFFDCAYLTSQESGINFTEQLVKIASAYSYPLLAYHADKDLKTYIRYIKSLIQIGYGGMYFYSYAIALKVLGKNNCGKIITYLKKFFGFTVKLV